MKMENKRTEYVSVWVTPEVKREVELNKDNPTIVENIIKRYLSSEKDFVEQELREIDDAAVKYKARLIGIREIFKEANDLYTAEIEEIYESGSKTLKKLDYTIKEVKKDIEYITKEYVQWSNLQLHHMERALKLMETFRYLSPEEKEMLKILMDNTGDKK